MAADAAAAKVRALQKQRERWMSERAMSQEREQTSHTLSSSQTNAFHTHANQSQSQSQGLQTQGLNLSQSQGLQTHGLQLSHRSISPSIQTNTKSTNPSTNTRTRPLSASKSSNRSSSRPSNQNTSNQSASNQSQITAYQNTNFMQTSSGNSFISSTPMEETNYNSLSDQRYSNRNSFTSQYDMQPIPPSNAISIDPISVRAQYEPKPEVVIDRLTEKIAARLRDEIKEELAREGREMMKHRGALYERVEKFLENEAENHSCSICYQLMVPPTHGPIILYPCGHTFCSLCINNHLSVNQKKTCPYCRKEITSYAPNLSLMNIIDTFIAKRERFRQGQMLPEIANSSFPSNPEPTFEQDLVADEQTETFMKQHQITAMRHQILTNELTDASQELTSIDKQLSTADVVLQHLKKERTSLEELVRQITAEIDVMKAQEEEQEKKHQSLSKQKTETANKIDMIRQTLTPLEQQMEKAQIIIQNLRRS
eukprot:TRINITY_DN4110_c0_g1_i1.p1 TRINITY_DN4110_c0_g1~~TRINITY_DN4110_c0_g1_i1.p1  ORF type:complete len:483 (+),score=127.36 TRINITY_DN4110_c0_g1_i1:44-1492(+)